MAPVTHGLRKLFEIQQELRADVEQSAELLNAQDYDLEFGDFGRGPSFLAGWWILPGLLVALLLWALLALMLFGWSLVPKGHANPDSPTP